ncbi:MAG: tail fiber domain-containing protein, partial [Rhodococcus sp. (in: high G+C Gram-positive bacteria)]|uniref:tail fiber domain-containing protein n=1 Tax=Rhodococcus sp. TaxID=1831 RepID=UPI003BB13495
MSRADSDAEQQRKRARLTARARHPMAWLRSRAARRRGLGDAARPVPTSADDVLERLADLKISTWTYGFDHRSVRHLGPMAQDFAEAFGLGSSDRRIDAGGA